MNHPCEDCRQSCDVPCWKVDHGLLVDPPRWIPASEPPKVWQEADPEHAGEPIEFIVMIEGAEVPAALCFDGEGFFDVTTLDRYKVTHWMPFPEAPKEDNQ